MRGVHTFSWLSSRAGDGSPERGRWQTAPRRWQLHGNPTVVRGDLLHVSLRRNKSQEERNEQTGKRQREGQMPYAREGREKAETDLHHGYNTSWSS